MSKDNSKIPVFEPIADGAISAPFTADGRLIPVVIIDTLEDVTLSNVISIHNDTPPGDVISIWGYHRFSKKNVFLELIFQQPLEYHMVIKFDLSKYLLLVDCIIQSRAIYLQPGKPGHKLSNDINAPKILIEIPARTTFEKWDSILHKHLHKRFVKKGISRSEIKNAVDEFISVRRDTWGPRMYTEKKR
ncbi:hypothetical protein V1581_04495 [Enterobacter bugandensis]|jgi:hypothetical protein|uniref:hypothetical protein n=1 Tax=Enterobacter TaxID=547 RepID=UPI0018696779|nr:MULTISPECIES: hypothetical protein [unclassified Enterobacter cloacae complex]MBE3180483.1 hypothetical protein [Enterobacter cloacae complex sp. P26RS]MBE3436107.1 hypothetical protein [Enterobacter cloacae complex sp. P21RS]MBE3461678.1 hypothetical protein [Enterobacter cloacae complex sp. P21C]MBE3497261.1 hypothetical protein [Enterobacter cloacae complex sp. P2B]MBE3504921.1 hypothetical protein [Enterobacter cloacae complex sp. I11]